MSELGGRVQDKVVIVTGGAGGIGSAACRAIAAEGGKVLVADYDAARARAIADGISADGGIAESVGVDVTDRTQVRAMVHAAVEAFGELNVIFNNAGINHPRGFMEVDEANFDDAGSFDVRRENAKQHLAFGKGIHFCLGAPLARMMGRCAFESLLSRLTNIRLAPGAGDVEPLESIFNRAPRALPLVFDRA